MIPVLAPWMPGGWRLYRVLAQRKIMELSSNSDELDFMLGYCVHSPGFHGFSWHLRERTYLYVGNHVWWSLLRTRKEKEWITEWPHSSNRDHNQVREGFKPRASWLPNEGASVGGWHHSFLYFFKNLIHKYYIYIISSPNSVCLNNSCSPPTKSVSNSWAVLKYYC